MLFVVIVLSLMEVQGEGACQTVRSKEETPMAAKITFKNNIALRMDH